MVPYRTFFYINGIPSRLHSLRISSGHMLACDLDEQRLFIEYVDKYCAKYFLGEDVDI